MHAPPFVDAPRTLHPDSNVQLVGRRCSAACARVRLRSSETSLRFLSPKPRPSAATTMWSRVRLRRRVACTTFELCLSLCRHERGLRALRQPFSRCSLQPCSRGPPPPTVAQCAEFEDSYELPSLSMDQVSRTASVAGPHRNDRPSPAVCSACLLERPLHRHPARHSTASPPTCELQFVEWLSVLAAF